MESPRTIRDMIGWIYRRREVSAADVEPDPAADAVQACGRLAVDADNDCFPRPRRLTGPQPRWPGPGLDNF